MERLRTLELAYTLVLLGTLGVLVMLGLGGLSGMVVFTIGQHQPPSEIWFKHALFGNASILVVNVTSNASRVVYTQSLPREKEYSLLGLRGVYVGNFTLRLDPLNLSGDACRVYSVTPVNGSGKLVCLGNTSCCAALNMTRVDTLRVNTTVFISRDVGGGNWTVPVRVEPAREELLCRENCSSMIPRGWRLFFKGEVVPTRIAYPASPLEAFSVRLVEQAARLVTLRVRGVAPLRVENATLLSATCNGSVVNVTENRVREACADAYLLLVEANASRVRVVDALGREGLILLLEENATRVTSEVSQEGSLRVPIRRVPERVVEGSLCEVPWVGRMIVADANLSGCHVQAGFDTRLVVNGTLRVERSVLSIPLGILVQPGGRVECVESRIETGPVSIVLGKNASLVRDACTVTGGVVRLSS